MDPRLKSPRHPAELLVGFSTLLPPRGRALDLACGSGRHSLFLAARGLRVVAIDRSQTALQEGRELALRRGLRVDWVRADLENYPLPSQAFDVIVCFYYRDPALYAPLRRALRPAGLLVYETYTREQLRFSSGPRNPTHLLEPTELLTAFADWNVIFYQERMFERGVASLVARKPMR
ncbi:MAG: class I SAM-dependent methyltransferase [Acidobacteria bacterium]|nr:class I SAM-dependent methyltransferase [Acidobacteriota bacterium]